MALSTWEWAKAGFAALAYIAVSTVSLVLLARDGLSGTAFAIIQVGTAFALLLLWNIDLVSQITGEFSEKGFKVRMERLERKLYARIETVRELGEELAGASAWAIARAGRFASKDHAAQVVERRSRLDELLNSLGVGPVRRREVLHPVHEIITIDFQKPFSEEFKRLVDEKFGPDPSPAKTDLVKKANELISDPTDSEACTKLRRFLESNTLNSPTMRELVDRWCAAVPLRRELLLHTDR